MRHFFSYVLISFVVGFGFFSYFLVGGENRDEGTKQDRGVAEKDTVVSLDVFDVEDMADLVRLREEAEEVTLSDLASLAEDLYLAGDVTVCEVFRVWLERDLNGARQWLLEKPLLVKESERRLVGVYYRNDEVVKPNVLVQTMGKDLFRAWMKRDRNGCFAFINQSSPMRNENCGWAILFWGSEGRNYCDEIYAYWRDGIESGKMPEAYYQSGFDFWGEWYQRNPASALAAMNDIPDATVRKNVLGRIVEQLQINDPEGAISLICENFEGESRKQSLMRAAQFFAHNDPRGALLFWSNTDMYGEDLAAIQQGIMSAIKVDELIAFFEDASLGLNELARSEIARDYFNAGFYEVEGRRFYGRVGSDADAEAKAKLLQYLDKGDREKLLDKIFEDGYDTEFAFLVYEQLSAEDRGKVWLGAAMYNAKNRASAAKFYAEHLYKETDNLGRSGFSFVVRDSIQKDRKKIEEWKTTLPEGRLRDVVQLLLDVDRLDKYYDGQFALLNAFYDKSAVRGTFIEEARDASKNNFDAYIRALNNTPHEDWAIDTIDNTFWPIFRRDESSLDRMVEGLKNKPELLAFLKRKFADQLSFPEDPKYVQVALYFAKESGIEALIKKSQERFDKWTPEHSKMAEEIRKITTF